VSQRRVANKSQLLNSQNVQKHDVQVDPDDSEIIMEVWVKDLSFLDVQCAAQEMVKVNPEGGIEFSLESYWRHAFANWVTKTNPELTADELCSLNGFAGERLSKILPQPNDLAEALQGGFRNPTETE
jgi:hypothetical protein